MMIVNEQQADAVVDLARGDLLIVRLKENATTGYRWFVDDADGLSLEASSTAGTAGASSQSSSAAAGSATGSNATGSNATGSNATGSSAAGSSATGSSATGAAGVREFRLRALREGTHHLRLKHWRDWQGESSVIDRYALTVRIA